MRQWQLKLHKFPNATQIYSLVSSSIWWPQRPSNDSPFAACIYTSKTIPEMIRSWENSFKANFNVGDCSFSVSWEGAGGHLNYFGILQRRATPKKFYDDNGSSYSSNPTGALPPRPPPPHKKWTVSEWSKSRVNGCWNVWKNSLKTQERVPNYKSVGKASTFLSFLSPPFPSPGPNVEQNLLYICA